MNLEYVELGKVFSLDMSFVERSSCQQQCPLADLFYGSCFLRETFLPNRIEELLCKLVTILKTQPRPGKAAHIVLKDSSG